MDLLEIGQQQERNDQYTVTMTDLANRVDDDSIQLATRKHRIRNIIKSENIKYLNTDTGWLLTNKDADKIKQVYISKWQKFSKTKKLVDENKVLQASIKEKDQEISDLKTTISDLQSKLDQANERLATALEQEQQTTHAQQVLSMRSSDAQKQLAEVQDKYVGANEKLIESQKQIIDQQKDISKKDIDIVKLKTELATETDKLKTELTTQKDKLMNRSLLQRIVNKDNTK